jgi:hypothetical protein
LWTVQKKPNHEPPCWCRNQSLGRRWDGLAGNLEYNERFWYLVFGFCGCDWKGQAMQSPGTGDRGGIQGRMKQEDSKKGGSFC